MKGHVIITLLFIVIVSKTSLGSDVFNELGVYEKSVSPTRIYRLWLMASQKYVLALYEKNRITLDSGNFTIIKRQINLKSQIDKKFSPATLPQKIYVTKNGLCESPNFLSRKIIWKKKYDTTIPWLYNPVANDLFEKGEYYISGKRPVYVKYTAAQKNKIVREQTDSINKVEAARNKRSEELLIIQETETSYLEIMEKYIPEYYSIMSQYYCGPGCFEEVSNGAIYHPGLDSVFSWGYENFDVYRMKFLNTTIHETVHKARYEIGVKKARENSDQKTYVLIDAKLNAVEVDFVELPKSEFILSIIPNQFWQMVPHELFKKNNVIKTILFRQSDYLTQNTTSNHHGIYGLMDEFSAYYHGFNASLLLYERNEAMFEMFHYADLNDLVSYEFAYYEFKLFIAWYLQYLYECEPHIYNKMAKNVNLINVYKSIEKAYNKRCNEFKRLIEKHDFIKKSYLAFRKNKITEIMLELERQKFILNKFTSGAIKL